jgi:hypothetical protein
VIGSEALSRWEPFNAAAQRGRLLEFAAALGSRDSALRRDECGDPRIIGGAWGYAKKAMSFSKVTQDGDEDWSGPLEPDRDQAADLTVCRVCWSSNCCGLR